MGEKITDLEIGKLYKSIINDDGDISECDVLILAKNDDTIISLLDHEYIETIYKDDLEKIKKMSFEELCESMSYYINPEIDDEIVFYNIKNGIIKTIHGFQIEFESIDTNDLKNIVYKLPKIPKIKKIDVNYKFKLSEIKGPLHITPKDIHNTRMFMFPPISNKRPKGTKS